MIIFGIFLFGNITVNAETAKFYEGQYIGDIYMSKYQPSTKTTYYQLARFFRDVNTNEPAYCIEPFSFFNDDSIYQPTLTPNNLTAAQKDRIEKIAYFGYGYKNHTEPQWYAITQFMIWQAADTSGDYYFTDTLNGNRITRYQNEMNEINNLIKKYETNPSFKNKKFTITENDSLVIKDSNNVIGNYSGNSDLISINNDTVTIKTTKEGTYNYTFDYNVAYHKKPIIFYQHATSQNLMKTGDLSGKQINITVDVVRTAISITKIDKDTQSIIPSGDASLDGAKYMLYDSNMNEIEELEIVNNEVSIENLKFGKYFIKETTPGTGYTLDEKTYEVNLNEYNIKQELILENEVIKKEITINKQYGEDGNFENEKDINFEIYDKNNQLVETIKTDETGTATVTLPYGEYTIVQKNSTEGYNKVSPIKINVEDIEDEKIELKDLKIPVPDTHTDFYKDLFIFIVQIVLIIIC